MSESPQAEILRKAGLKTHQVLVPSDANFDLRQASYWSRNARSLRPACIVQPQSAQDVATAVRSLVAANIPFAVRSGGHTAWAGANNIGSNGVTIDLHRLDGVDTVPNENGKKDTVRIGPGNQWSKVYTDLAKEGLAVAGGREGNVGVGGLILGGGMAFYSARYGLACDNVVEYEVVLADGRIVYPRADGEHANLFKALKGGGNNFGIVTNFRMRTLPACPVWAGMTVHPKEAIPDAIRALVDFTDHISDDVDSNLLCFFTYTGNALNSAEDCPEFKDIVVAGALIQVAGVEEAPAYKSWLEMPTTASTCKITTVPQLTIDYSQATEYHNTWFTATFKNDARIVAKAAELHDELVGRLKVFIPDGDFVTQCLFQPFPSLFGRLSAKAGGNVLGIDQQPHNALLWLAVAQVRTVEQEKFVYGLVRDWVHAVQEFAGSLDGGNLQWTYLNYADKIQDPLASYGTANVRFMQNVAEKYDPQHVFQTLCSGGFKLSNAKILNQLREGDKHLKTTSRASKL